MDRLTKTENGDNLFYVVALETRPHIENFSISMIDMIQHEEVGILKDLLNPARITGRKSVRNNKK